MTTNPLAYYVGQNVFICTSPTGKKCVVPVVEFEKSDLVVVIPSVTNRKIVTKRVYSRYWDDQVIAFRGSDNPHQDGWGDTIWLPLAPSPEAHGELLSLIPGWAVGDNIRARITVKNLMQGITGSNFTMSVVAWAGQDQSVTVQYDDLGSGYSVFETSDRYIPYNASGAAVYIQFYYAMFVQIQKVEFSKDAGANWALVKDGDFSSGIFVDDYNNGWSKDDYGINFKMAPKTGGFEVKSYWG